MKTWYIYFLPNAPKVGLTSRLKARLYANKNTLGLDISDWRILEEFRGERSEAHKIELKWQKKLNCVDGKRSIQAREQMKKPRPQFSKEWRQNQKRGSAGMETSTCPVCGKTMKLNIFRGRGHGELCQQKRKENL
jgi:hypothetical protein